MKSKEISNQEPPKRASIPLWLGFVLALLVWGAIPWALSLLTPRFGWAGGHSGLWNLPGLFPVTIGTTGLLWGLLQHSAQTHQRLDMEPTKNYLLKDGPYRFSRNPMYLSELILMFGWIIFYGSVALLLGFIGWWTFFNFYQVPSEERILEARFGEFYSEYKNEVPRWVGKIRR
jgi:protein-S-isoprenylcysteine O-methyltransferase Ste14